MIPRLPLIPTIIVMYRQHSAGRRTYYCETCKKSYFIKEIDTVYSCCSKEKAPRFMDISGRVFKNVQTRNAAIK